MKKLVVFWVAVLLVMSSFSFTFADYEENGYWYKLNDDGDAILTIYKLSNAEKDDPVILPSEIGGHTVVELDDYFMNARYETDKKGTSNLVIPDTVTKIGAYCFSDHQFTSVDIPDSVTEIGSHAFFGNRFKYVDFPDGLEIIGSGAFWKNDISILELPSNLKTLGSEAFAGNNISEYSFPEQFNEVPSNIFASNNFKTIHIPSHVEIIDAHAFRNNELETVTFDEGCKVIWHGAFAENKINSVKLPNTLTIIYSDAFLDNQLTSIEIPQSVYKIEEDAFKNSGLTSLMLPELEHDELGYVWYWTSSYSEVPLEVTDFSKEYVRRQKKIYDVNDIRFDGKLEYGQTITMKPQYLGAVDGEFSFEWYRDDQPLNISGDTYTITADDIGKKLGVRVKNSVETGSAMLYAEDVCKKAKNPVTSVEKPGLIRSYDTSIVVQTRNGYEYLIVPSGESVSKGTWQTSSLFKGLSPASRYDIYQRVKETDEYEASEISMNLDAFTMKSYPNPNKGIMIELSSRTNTSISVVEREGYEYVIVPSGENIYMGVWQDSPIFNNLQINTTYDCAQRVKETSTHYSSIASDVLSVSTLKNPCPTPKGDLPTLLSKTDVSVSLNSIEGYEYQIVESGNSLIENNWSSEALFNNLIPNKSYELYQRIKETDVYEASGPSDKLIVTTDKSVNTVSPIVAVLKEATSKTITLEVAEGYEYLCVLSGEDISTGMWQSSNKFTGLGVYTAYDFYQRIKETDTHFASATSGVFTTKTKKEPCPVKKGVDPQLSKVTANEIHIVQQVGYEYICIEKSASITDGVWTDNSIFLDLEPNREFLVFQRVKETSTNESSEISNGLSILTKKYISDPIKGIVAETTSVTHEAITLKEIDGYEYLVIKADESIDTGKWQISILLKDLLPNKSYDIYQRLKETDTTYASEISDRITVKTDKAPPQVSKAVTPVLKEKTSTDIILETVDGYEYLIVKADDDMKKGVWADSPVFENLEINTPYDLYQRLKETDTHYSSEESEKLQVKTKKEACLVIDIEKPQLISKSYDEMILKIVNGYEYQIVISSQSIDADKWQDDSIFKALEPNKSYDVYQRVKETNDYESSEISDKLTIITDKQPSTIAEIVKPNIESITHNMIKLEKIDGYEYMVLQSDELVSDGVWSQNSTFSGLKSNTEYYFYQRIGETETTLASKVSEKMIATTKKKPSTIAKGALPKIKVITSEKITLLPRSGYEYLIVPSGNEISISNWQDSYDFTSLTVNTSYDIYQRIKETAVYEASLPSDKIVAVTKKYSNEIAKASTPTLNSKDSYSITLNGLAGYEYLIVRSNQSISTGKWQDTWVFYSLSSSTTYDIYQRVKETESHYASGISNKLIVSTERRKSSGGGSSSGGGGGGGGGGGKSSSSNSTPTSPDNASKSKVDKAKNSVLKNSTQLNTKEDVKTFIENSVAFEDVLKHEVQTIRTEKSAVDFAATNQEMFDVLAKNVVKLENVEERKEMTKVVAKNINTTKDVLDKIQSAEKVESVTTDTIKKVGALHNNLNDVSVKSIDDEVVALAEEAVNHFNVKKVAAGKVASIKAIELESIIQQSNQMTTVYNNVLLENNIEVVKPIEQKIKIDVASNKQLDQNIILDKISINRMDYKNIDAIVLSTASADVEVPVDVLKDMNKTSDVQFRVNSLTSDLLTPDQKEQVGESKVYEFKATAGDSIYTSFKEPITIKIPYTQEVADSSQVVVYYLKNDMQLESMAGVYDEYTKTVSFKTNHFSKFIIKECTVNFVDLKSYPWAETQIKSVAAKEIMQGVSDYAFGPYKTMTISEVQKSLGIMTQGSHEAVINNDQIVTNQTLSNIVCQILLDNGYKLVEVLDEELSTDLQPVIDVNASAVATVLRENVFEGIPMEEFDAHKQATKGEIAVVLYNLYQKLY